MRSGSAINELQLVNSLREWFKSHPFTVLQLVSPGGQAIYSLFFSRPTKAKKKLIYPDLIAIGDKEILIGEVKPLFSQADHDKLIDLLERECAREVICRLVSRITDLDVSDYRISYWLIHSGSVNKNCDSRIKQLLVSRNDDLVACQIFG